MDPAYPHLITNIFCILNIAWLFFNITFLMVHYWERNLYRNLIYQTFSLISPSVIISKGPADGLDSLLF